MNIVERFIEKEEKIACTHEMFRFKSEVGIIYVSLEDNTTIRSPFRYVVKVTKGVTSEYAVFMTMFFAHRYFDKLRKRYEGSIVEE